VILLADVKKDLLQWAATGEANMAFFNRTIKSDGLPRHIAIIMDGNGRWAKSRGLSRSMGHKAGAECLKKIVEECNNLKIKHLTVYAFSTENWNRPQSEVDTLMNLLRDYIQRYIDDSENNNIKIDIIGDVKALAPDIQEKIEVLYSKTKNKKGLNLHIAINYGGRDELIRAMKSLCTDVSNKKINMGDISEELFDKYLDTTGIPSPELMIRTSGEKRLSNFLLWQLAYTEFYFTDKLWPDFDIKQLHKALISYQNRNRRFGGI
jgi:undecaprenyl diphosphate synthase